MAHFDTTNISVTLLFAMVAIATSGCDGTTSNATAPTQIAGSCNSEANGFCVEYTGADYQLSRVEKSCASQKTAFIAGPCPAADRVGTCLVYKGKRSEAYYRYYSGFPGYGVTPKEGVVAAGKEQCAQLKGDWIP